MHARNYVVTERIPTSYQKAAIGIRALYVLRKHSPDRICPAFLVSAVGAASHVIAKSLNRYVECGLLRSEPFPAALGRDTAVDRFYSVDPDQADAVDREIAANRERQS